MPETIEPANKQAILSGRDAVDAYREAHRLLHEQVKDRTVHDRHTPLLNKMVGDLKAQSFKDMGDFFAQSRLVNLNELGFIDQADFEAKATEADREALEQKWQ